MNHIINGNQDYWQPTYFLKDHLGNTRVQLAANADGTLATVQTTDYYPFGMEHEGVSPSAYAPTPGTSSPNPYLYNGKEMDRMHGLNMYDYGARFYDPAVGRFGTVDPLGEKYYSISHYAYCAGNPVNRIDVEGKFTIFINGQNLFNSGEGYWDDFDNKFLKKFNDHKFGYIDGSLGGWINTLSSGINNNMIASNRIRAGEDWGNANIRNIIGLLHRNEVTGMIDEKLRIVTHSMGSAFGKGIIHAIMKYVESHPELCAGLSIDNYDFDPFQGASLRAEDNVFTYQAIHKGKLTRKNISDNPLLASEKEQNMEKSSGNIYNDDSKSSPSHNIKSFSNLINKLEQGTYKWNGQNWVKQ
jgi:RHS repeat-associated protein